MKTLCLLAAAAALAGCAHQDTGLYQWGSYDELLSQSYESPKKVGALRKDLEQNIGQIEKRNRKVPPGEYAELGTLYLQANDPGRAVAYYSKERDAWPESKGLMDSLIQTIERRQQGRAQQSSEPAKAQARP